MGSTMTIRVVLMATTLLASFDAAAQTGGLRKALYGCLSRALLTDSYAETVDIADGHTSAALICQGRDAEELYRAMELHSTQSAEPDGSVLRSGGAINCHRSRGASFTCFISIPTTEPFLRGMR
jgi:hypothetical protein